MPTDLTLDALAETAARFTDPDNDCDACGDTMPGVLAPMLPDGDDAHPFVQRCDSCNRHEDDEAAATALGGRAGLVVRRRYDDRTLQHWRPFVATPGSPDDRDTYGVDANEFGCWPAAEFPVREKSPSWG